MAVHDGHGMLSSGGQQPQHTNDARKVNLHNCQDAEGV